MYRVLHQKYGKVGEDTEALLIANNTRIGAHQATDIKDLADKLVTLELAVEAHEVKMRREPDRGLLGSALTSRLDPQTSRSFAV